MEGCDYPPPPLPCVRLCVCLMLCCYATDIDAQMQQIQAKNKALASSKEKV